jgi:glycerophosphoryl diester phosphodiesterase
MKKWTLPFIIAHRGAPQLAPENTIASLQTAAKLGASWVECDVQLTKDGKPVILHDTTLSRTTSGSGSLSDTTFSKVQTLDAGSWFSPEFKDERVPTLQQWLQTTDKLKLGLILEIKSATKKESIALAECVIDHLQKYWPPHSTNLMISSSNPFVLKQVAERAKSIPLGFITKEKITEKKAEELLQANITSVHQYHKTLEKPYIEMLHEMGLRVLAYTVNDAVRAQELRSMGVDGIFTDDVRVG